MKRLIFAFLVAISSAICIGLLLRTQDVSEMADASEKLGLRSADANDVLVLSASGELSPEGSGSTEWVKAQTLGSVDLILSSQDSADPKVTHSQEKTRVEIGNGLYLFVTNDLFGNYEIVSDRFSITHIAKGVFFVDTRSSEIRIYSLSAILNVGLLTDGKAVTGVDVFPSTLFIYDPSYNADLQNVDTFRVSQVDTLRMVDFSTESGAKLVFATAPEEPQKLFAYYKSYAVARDAKLKAFYQAFRENGNKSDLTIMDRYAMLFVNDEKKHVMLRNSLINSLQKLLLLDKGLCDADCKKDAGSQDTLIGNITSRIDDLQGMDPSYGEDARNLVRRYVALGTFQTERKATAYFKQGKSALVTLVGKVFGKGVSIDERYRLLSEMFGSYYFATAKSDDLAKNMDGFIRYLVDGKGIGDQDFVSFVFFLKEYLSLRSGEIDENILGISYDMMRIADSYLGTLQDPQERFSALTTLFYTFNTIFDTARNNLLTKYFDGTPDNLVLKDQYRSGDTSMVPSDFFASYKKTVNALGEFIGKYKDEFYAALGAKQGDVTDNYVLLSATADKLKGVATILDDYATYRKNLALSDDARNASGIILGGSKLSKENLLAYLSQFDGMDTGSLQLTNDPEKDGFYDVRVSIAGYPFSFALREPGNTLTNLVYTDESGNTNQDFQQAAISLDERQKLMRDKMSVARTPEERTKYDFKNYFRTTFFKSMPTTDGGAPVAKPIQLDQPSYPEMSPDMQLTVQHELIEKDFSNLASFIPISIRNVYAKVENGIYDIDIYGVRFTARGMVTIYPIELKAKYVFTEQEHAFMDVSLKILNDDQTGYQFGGLQIRIQQTKIELADFQQKFADLGKYLDTLRQKVSENNGANPNTATIDFDSKQIYIDGTPYPLTQPR